MIFILPIYFLVLLLFTNCSKAVWQPKIDTTWNIILKKDGFDIKKEKNEVIDIDLHSNSAEDIQNFHNAGKKVICYFSGGTLEDFRPDKDEYYKVDGLVKNDYKQWKGENWLDFRKEGIKPLITNRMKLAVEKKCDAIDVDNLDGYQDKSVQKKWSEPLTKEDTITFAKWLSATAHSLGLAIGLKNSLFMIDEVGQYFDFAINESCATNDYPECHLYKSFLDSGKAVFGITYEIYLKDHYNRLCDALDGLKISMIIKKEELIQSGKNFNTHNCPFIYTLGKYYYYY
ncbi:hypothetical protein BCR36DRAFT_276643 [Piromyces finnis]|uniref:alpha-galactosidase n=1 Tax=Piromyces finnis TaxID=1754191 RepID=A0A1Y1VLM0_9FUNG|nr:hypothetical protein BCR36DRAFT_276643 [Piromyces finnis]|eukprot:ORX58648.1 hypothetical protein BCR36DRAFT_276643 [Piromyces finnis]